MRISAQWPNIDGNSRLVGLVARTDFDGTDRSHYGLCFSAERNLVERDTATLLKDGEVLIVGGGDATAELFDPATGTFSFTGPPIVGRLHATATLLSDGRVLIAGGLGLTAGPDRHLPLLNTAEIFDPATGPLRSTGTMVQARQQQTATLLADGRVLVAGGY